MIDGQVCATVAPGCSFVVYGRTGNGSLQDSALAPWSFETGEVTMPLCDYVNRMLLACKVEPLHFN
jgi:hypothetical protein